MTSQFRVTARPAGSAHTAAHPSLVMARSGTGPERRHPGVGSTRLRETRYYWLVIPVGRVVAQMRGVAALDDADEVQLDGLGKVVE